MSLVPAHFDVHVLVCTHGDVAWADLAGERAVPSARSQGALVSQWHREDATLAEVRNEAAAESEADWLCFLDADDELAPGYFHAMDAARQAHFDAFPDDRFRPWLLVPAVSFVERKIAQTWPPGATPGDPVYGETWSLVERSESEPEIPNGGGSRPLIDVNCAVIGTLVPRRLFLDVGGFRELAALEDWDLWLRCEDAGARLVPVPDAVYRAWVRRGSRNADQSLYHQLRAQTLARREG